MKLNISAEIDGPEIVENFVAKLKESDINTTAASIKLQIQNKAGEFVDFPPEKLKLTFVKE